jgi:hypothetical protein
MAELTQADKIKITKGMMQYWSTLFEEIGLTKTELYQAVSATDTWIDDNAASYVAALPAAAQSGLTDAQKTILFCIVAAYRVSEALAVKLVGGLG